MLVTCASDMSHVLFFLLLCCQAACAARHSLWHVYTVSSGIPRLPSMMAVVLVDGVVTEHYDSNTRAVTAKRAWMDAVLVRDPDYWKEQTTFWQKQEHFGNINMEILKTRFNQSDGVHVFQVLHGCEYDDEDRTGAVWGFNRHSYDAEDTLVLDMERQRWIWLRPQMEPTGRKWNLNEGWLEFMEHRLLKECPRRLRQTLEYGKDVLLRIRRPRVSLLQTHPSANITCHATGFYPDKVDMYWTLDGQQLHHHVDHDQLLPNHDGSFQLSVHLREPAEDWGRYACVFKLDGLAEEIVTVLDATRIRTNYVKPAKHDVTVIAAAVFCVAVAVGATSVGIYICRRRRHDHGGTAAQTQRSSPDCVYFDADRNVRSGGDGGPVVVT
ncbi:zinc-alpha-2-glycoprotein-like [Corythoichthys intestinalis]|uniref:zinc-alpha-2-glycoprotein-like n=1 Tax=Corythoichthys intestinalis TaxID=161448 RepID=UPI0025A61DEB|nr:zinc-alpha-2-glycoprotein-like [Corythoichthys intestinalis]